jgi:hypothetical protein
MDFCLVGHLGHSHVGTRVYCSMIKDYNKYRERGPLDLQQGSSSLLYL